MGPAGRRIGPRAEALALAAVLALALLFRLGAASVPRMNTDEGWTYYLCQNPVPEILGALERDRHPPGAYLWTAAWLRLGSHEELPLRLPFALLACLGVGLTWRVGREITGDPEAALAGALFHAVSYPAWEHETWMRGQAALPALALASTGLLLAGLRAGRWTWGVGYGLASAAMLYTHYLGALVLLAHAGALALWSRRLPWRSLGVALGGLALAAALLLPWLPSLLAQLQARAGRDLGQQGRPSLAWEVARGVWAQAAGLDLLPWLVEGPQADPGPWAAWLQGAGWLVFGGLALLGWARLRARPGAQLLPLAALLPLALILLGIAARFPELSRPRYLAPWIPWLGLLLGAGVARAGRIGWGVLGLLLGINAWALAEYRGSPLLRSADWATPAAWVGQREGRIERVVAFDSYVVHPFHYYYAREEVAYVVRRGSPPRLEYAPGFRRPRVDRVWAEEVANGQLEARTRGAARLVLMLWYEQGDPSVRTWFGQRYGVVDQLLVPNRSFEGLAELYELQALERPGPFQP